MPNLSSYDWKQQTLSDDYAIIDCPKYDTYKNFIMDPSECYVLIKVNFEYFCIDVGICNKDHQVMKVFRGQTAQSISHTIFQYEKNNDCSWFKEKTHMTYLGKELKKAELALTLGQTSYFQE